MKNRLLTMHFLLLLASVSHTFAQQAVRISGKVVDAGDQQPLHAVSVSIDRKGVGTSTNSAGLFALIIPPANLNDTLKVSSIGFKTQRLPIAGIRNELNIILEKNSTELKEVNIGYRDPLKIIQKALERIKDNYINHPHIIRGFYRMYTFNEDTPLELSEAVFDVYNFGYADKRADVFRLVKARYEKNQRDFSMIELGQKPNSVFEDDIVNHLFTSGFLSDEGLTKHRFEVTGPVDIKGYEAYEIDFKEKSASAEGTYRGKMFIDTKTYAFIYFDYGLSPGGLKDLGSSNFGKHVLLRVGDVNIGLTRDHYKVGYQQVGDKWVLADVEGENIIRVDNLELKTSLPAHVKFNYQVTAVDTAQTASFSSKIGRNESINNHDSNEGEKFWKDYNILLSDYNTEDIFNHILDINKSIKLK